MGYLVAVFDGEMEGAHGPGKQRPHAVDEQVNTGLGKDQHVSEPLQIWSQGKHSQDIRVRTDSNQRHKKLKNTQSFNA